jgi:hypothetical protein
MPRVDGDRQTERGAAASLCQIGSSISSLQLVFFFFFLLLLLLPGSNDPAKGRRMKYLVKLMVKAMQRMAWNPTGENERSGRGGRAGPGRCSTKCLADRARCPGVFTSRKPSPLR